MPSTANPTPPNSRKLYKVFVSSTYLDNTERRQIVQHAITAANMVWYRNFENKGIINAERSDIIIRCSTLIWPQKGAKSTKTKFHGV